MISLSTLNGHFYNGRYGESISFSDLHAKTRPISQGEGVPRYTYSESLGSYIPTSGFISLSDFNAIRVQTGSITVINSENITVNSHMIGDNCYKIPQTMRTNHSSVVIKKAYANVNEPFNHSWAEIYMYGTHLCNISVFYSYSSHAHASSYGYGPLIYIPAYNKIEVKSVSTSKPHLIISDDTDGYILGQYGSTLNPGTHRCDSVSFSLIVTERELF